MPGFGKGRAVSEQAASATTPLVGDYQPTRRDRLAIPTLVSASTISNVGNGITSLAIPWFVLVTTGSAARTGIAGGLVVLALVVSGMFGGALVDRIGFKRASIISDLLSGVTVAIIPTLHYLDVLEYWHLLVLIFAGAIFDAPGDVARRSLVPAMARRVAMPLERANSAMELASQSSRSLLAPIVAGLLIGLMGAAAVLYIDAATFAVSILLIGLLIRQPRRETETASGAGPQGSSYLADFKAGFAYTIKDPFLSVIIPVSVLYNFIFSPTIAVFLPVFAKEEFDSASALGLIIAAFGAGSAIGTLAYGARGHLISRFWILMVTVVLLAGTFWLLAAATAIWMAMAALFVAGLAIGPTNVLAMTIVQNSVPEEMLGRVFGFMFAFGSAAAPLGVFLGGFLVEGFGFRAGLIAAAIGATCAMLWVTTSRRMRAAMRGFDEHVPDPAA